MTHAEKLCLDAVLSYYSAWREMVDHPGYSSYPERMTHEAKLLENRTDFREYDMHNAITALAKERGLKRS